MKHSIMIQRLCLFLLVLVLAAPAWAQWTPPTVYEQQGYELFRSRWTVKFFGKNKPVRTLSQGKVEIEFSDCKTTSGTGNSAIYELAKGSTIKVKAIKGYAIAGSSCATRRVERTMTTTMASSASAVSKRTMTITSRRMPSRTRI